jgi:hypothetical protein
MPLSAWITSIVVALVLYGGLGWCIAVAVRKGREGQQQHQEGWSESSEE